MKTILTILVVLLFLIGTVSLISGIIVLIRKAFSKEVEEITKFAVDLAEKGVRKEIGSTMDNAGVLIGELNELIKTNRGVGLTLIFTGCALYAGGVLIIKQFLI